MPDDPAAGVGGGAAVGACAGGGPPSGCEAAGAPSGCDGEVDDCGAPPAFAASAIPFWSWSRGVAGLAPAAAGFAGVPAAVVGDVPSDFELPVEVSDVCGPWEPPLVVDGEPGAPPLVGIAGAVGVLGLDCRGSAPRVDGAERSGVLTPSGRPPVAGPPSVRTTGALGAPPDTEPPSTPPLRQAGMRGPAWTGTGKGSGAPAETGAPSTPALRSPLVSSGGGGGDGTFPSAPGVPTGTFNLFAKVIAESDTVLTFSLYPSATSLSASSWRVSFSSLPTSRDIIFSQLRWTSCAFRFTSPLVPAMSASITLSFAITSAIRWPFRSCSPMI